MTVKELIEGNGFIGDITIEIRGKSHIVMPGYENKQSFSSLQQDWHIGAKKGIKPPCPSKVGTYIKKNINEKDDGKGYYNLVLSRIPKELLGLHVVNWRVWPSYRGIGNKSSLEHLIISAWTDETKEMAEQQELLQQLEKASNREKQENEADQEHLPGQMNINEWLDSG